MQSQPASNEKLLLGVDTVANHKFRSPISCIMAVTCGIIFGLYLGEQIGWPALLIHRGHAALCAVGWLTISLGLIAVWTCVGLAFGRRAFQWHVQHLLLLMLVFGFVINWILGELRSTEQQARAIRNIEGYGGYFKFEPKPDAWQKLCSFLGYECLSNPIVLILSEDEGVGVTDAQMEVLQPDFATLPQLSQLKFSSFVSDPAMFVIKDVRGLKDLDLSHTGVTDVGMRVLSNMREIEVLNLSYTKTTGEGLQHVPWKRLRELHLAGAALTPTGMQQIARFRELNRLSLNSSFVTDECVKSVGNIPLQTLNISETAVTDAGLVWLQSLTELESLQMSNSKITGDGFRYLISLPKLKLLSLYGSKIDDAGLEHVQYFSCLENLDLAGTDVTYAGLLKLKNLKTLKFLHLQHIPLDESELLTIAQFPNLRKLCVYDSKIGKTRLAELQKQLPTCELIY